MITTASDAVETEGANYDPSADEASANDAEFAKAIAHKVGLLPTHDQKMEFSNKAVEIFGNGDASTEPTFNKEKAEEFVG